MWGEAAKPANHFYISFAVCSFPSPFFPVRDLGIPPPCLAVLDRAGAWPPLGHIRLRFVTRLSLYQCRGTRVLQNRRGVGRATELPCHCGGMLLVHFRSFACRWAYSELPSDRGTVLGSCGSRRIDRHLQRELDASNPSYGTACQSTCLMAWPEGGIDQRSPFGTCAKWQFSAADGVEDFAARAACNFYRRRSV